jgi:hypothetical protein
MNGLSLFGSEALGIHCIFDPTHTSRYVWSYELSDPTRRLMFSGLNPSKADEHRFDNTVKKWIAWTRAWGVRRARRGERLRPSLDRSEEAARG